jgi:hypothetical protein
MSASAFLDRLFESAPAELWGYYWRLAGQTTEAWPATAHPDTFLGQRDVYLGVSLSTRSLAVNERVKADESAGILAFWADVDVAGPAHQKTNLPPSYDDALWLIDQMPLRPTVIIHSGHGLQPWWFLKEPWLFATAEERADGAACAAGWQALLRQKARDRGWDVDSTGDLARVMRLPGTLNAKLPAAVVPVREGEGHWDYVYDPSDFRPFLPEAKVSLNGHAEIEAEEPRYLEIKALLNSHRGAKMAYERKMKTGDISPSGQDMALAIAAAYENWPAARIAGLLKVCREENGEDLKHPTYYSLTVSKAVQFVQAERTQNKQVCDLTEFTEAYQGNGATPANAAEAAPESSDQDQKRRDIIDMIQRITGIGLLQVVRHTSTPPIYRLVLEQGQLTLGGIDALCDQNLFRRKVFDFTRHYPPAVNRRQWDAIPQALMKIAEDEETDEEGNHCTAGPAWLRDYLSDNPPVGELIDAIHSDSPFMRDGRTGFFLRSLRQWLLINRAQKLTVPAIASILRQAGCRPTSEKYHTPDGKRTTCYVWWVPDKG